MVGSTSRFAGVVTIVAIVALVVTGPVTAQSSSGLGLTATAGDATAGETVTVSFTAENTGSEPVAVVLNVTDRPDGWAVDTHSDDGGTWNDDENETKWLFQTLASGDSVAPSVTFAVPSTAAGEYTVGANLSTLSASTTAETTVTVEQAANDTISAGGPGFGVVAALCAVVAVGLVARRRH